MSEYVFDSPDGPTNLPATVRPYGGPLVPRSGLGGPLQGGSDLDTAQLVKALLLVAGIVLLCYLLFVRKTRSNPAKGTKRAKIEGNRDDGYYWRLTRKGAVRHGPFTTGQEAADDAEDRGYYVLGFTVR